MRRYYIGFLIAAVVSQAVGIGTAVAFFSQGMFGWGIYYGRALWQDLLCLILPLLVGLAVGEWMGREPDTPKISWKWALAPVLVMVAVSLASAGRKDLAMMLPGGALERVMEHLFNTIPYNRGGLAPVGQAALAVLYHVGWLWGTKNNISII